VWFVFSKFTDGLASGDDMSMDNNNSNIKILSWAHPTFCQIGSLNKWHVDPDWNIPLEVLIINEFLKKN
jgi:hypothetical protein